MASNTVLTRMLYRILLKKAKTCDANGAIKALIWRPTELRQSTNETDRELDALYDRLFGSKKAFSFVPRYARPFVETEGVGQEWNSFRDFIKAEFRRPVLSPEENSMRLDVTLYAIKEINRCFRAYAVIEERSTSPDVVFDEREIEGHSPARARKTQPLRRSKARDGAKNVKSSIEIAKETKRTRKQQSSFPLDPQITVEKEIPSDFTFESTKKYYLVAHPLMRDYRFKSAVVVLTQHDANGSAGFTINLPSSYQLRHIHPKAPKMWRSQIVFGGGPVNNTISSIRRLKTSTPGSADENEANVERKFFQGKSLWSPGQLDREIESGQWILLSGSEELIFAPFFSSSKREVLSRQTNSFWSSMVAHCPGEISHWKSLAIEAPLVPEPAEEEDEDDDDFDDDDEEEEV